MHEQQCLHQRQQQYEKAFSQEGHDWRAEKWSTFFTRGAHEFIYYCRDLEIILCRNTVLSALNMRDGAERVIMLHMLPLNAPQVNCQRQSRGCGSQVFSCKDNSKC